MGFGQKLLQGQDILVEFRYVFFTGIRRRAVDSLNRVRGCYRRIRRILSPPVHCQIRELDLKLN